MEDKVMYNEKNIQKILARDFNDKGRLWINDNGFAYHKIGGSYIGFRYGLGVGISDLIGFTEVEIDESMVGKRLPIFTAFEVKKGRGKASIEQENFIKFIRSKGGISGIVYDNDNIEKEIEKWRMN